MPERAAPGDDDTGGRARCTRPDRLGVELDTSDTGGHLAAGLDAAQPTAWLAEGLLPYLPAAAETALLTTVDALSAAGSSLEIENFTTLVSQVQDPTFRRLAARFGVDMPALLHQDDREGASSRLARHGWTVESELAAHVAASYGRELDPLSQRLDAESEYLTATRWVSGQPARSSAPDVGPPRSRRTG